MDRSFPIFDRIKAFDLIVGILFMIAVSAIGSLGGGNSFSDSILCYPSMHSTMIVLYIGLTMMLANELYSKYHSFVIASGTDRNDFIRIRFISMIAFNIFAALIMSCIEFAFNGINDRTISLMVMNIFAVLVATTVFMCVFTSLGATIRTNAQVIAMSITMICGLMFFCTIAVRTVIDTNPSPASLAVFPIAAVIATAIGYLFCRWKIGKVDM